MQSREETGFVLIKEEKSVCGGGETNDWLPRDLNADYVSAGERTQLTAGASL